MKSPRVSYDLISPRPMRVLVGSRLFPVALQVAMLVVLVLLVVNGLGLGLDLTAAERMTLRKTNLTTLVVWGLWWPGMIAVAVLLGRLWCTVCPMELANRLADAAARRIGWPRARLGKVLGAGWTIVVGYLTLQVLVAGVSVHFVPHYTAILLLVLLGGACLCGLVFRAPRSFCHAFCPVGALLSVYGRYTPLQLDTRDPDLCDRCTSKDCVRSKNRYKADKRSCPSLLRPFRRAPSDGCVLCLQCAKVCPHHNIGVGIVASDAPTRRKTPLKPYEAVFVLVALGFVTNEWVDGVKWLEPVFHWVPVQLATQVSGVPPAWLDALWFLVLFPFFVWGGIASLGYFAGHRSGLRPLLLAVATGAAPVVAIAHLAKAVAKINHWGGFVPQSLRDPHGMETLRGLAGQARPAPTALLDLTILGWLMLVLLIPVSWRAWRWVQQMQKESIGGAHRPTRARSKLAVAGAAVVLLIVGATTDHLSTKGRARVYNAYIEYSEAVRPLLVKHDALLQQIGVRGRAHRKRHLDGWIATAASLRSKLSTIHSEADEINTFHAHLVASAQSLTASLESVKAYYERNDQAALATWARLTKETGIHLNAFIQGRDATRNRLSH